MEVDKTRNKNRLQRKSDQVIGKTAVRQVNRNIKTPWKTQYLK